MRRLRPLSEAECYARCYGAWELTVSVVQLPSDHVRAATSLNGESIRARFEEFLDAREPGAEAQAA